MADSVFVIRNLKCAYSRKLDDKVLEVDYLEIPRGELIFLLGSSGSGKSTLLEALGLMNNTIAEGEVLFHPTADSTGVNIAQLWLPENFAKAAEIRKSNYSFIFQNTNLMENFTAYENICLSRMIQDDVQQEQAMGNAKMLMEKVGLPENLVGTSTVSVNLSGGQRQRVAFVRALNSDCTVLFGDEPTGNLDEGNANELMEVVKNYLGHRVSAIIVSHDINLALNHASRIICISRHAEHQHGEILPENIYERNYWERMSAEELAAFRGKLKQFYSNPKSQPISVTDSRSQKQDFKKSFTGLFLKKEGLALAGKSHINLLLLTILLFFTFLAIGFANGSIEYLEKKIKNPFVLWLTVTIPHAKSDEAVSDIKRALNSESVKKEYLIKSVTSYAESPLFIWSKKDSALLSVKARSVEMSPDYTDPILSEIVSTRNLITPGPNNVNGFRDFKDFSIIVTRRFLHDFGYSESDRFIQMEFQLLNDSTGEAYESRIIPVGIRAVVEEIPGKIQAAYSLYFYRAFQQANGSAFDIRDKHNLIFYTAGNENEAQQLRQTLEKIVAKLPQLEQYKPEVGTPAKNRDSYDDGFEVRLSFISNPENYRTLDSIYAAIVNNELFKPYKGNVLRLYDYYNFNEDFQDKVKNDELSVNFLSLDKVRNFAGYMLRAFNDRDEIRGGGIIEVDIGKVIEKENFNFLSNITKIISLVLLLFGVVSVSLFVLNLLKMHLQKVKMNIGTFQAFGLSNAKAQSIYFFIILRFVAASIAIAFVLAFGVGMGLDSVLPMFIHVEDEVSYFKLIAPFTFITLILILITGLLVSWITIQRMLSKSPGDLIYNR